MISDARFRIGFSDIPARKSVGFAGEVGRCREYDRFWEGWGRRCCGRMALKADGSRYTARLV
jgi:hypothetical protein